MSQKKSNNIHDLNSKIWDQWADKDGLIGKAYGYQVGKKYQFKQGIMDQMDNVLWALKNEPYSRRIMISLWNTSELHEMALEPCCWNVIFNVTDEGYDKPILNMILNQRSQDVLTANNWNVCQFAGLLMMVAQASDMIPGVLMHVIADSHIYDRHIPLVKELITRESYPAPIVTLDPDIKDFYQFTKNSFKIENYEFGEQLQIEVAI